MGNGVIWDPMTLGLGMWTQPGGASQRNGEEAQTPSLNQGAADGVGLSLEGINSKTSVSEMKKMNYW